MTLDQKTVGDICVLTPKHNLVGGKETDEFIAATDAIGDGAAPKIVVDLGKIDWLTSRGLGALVKVNTTCINRQGWMRLARVGGRIKSAMLITRLVMVFDTYDSVEEALAGTHRQGT